MKQSDEVKHLQQVKLIIIEWILEVLRAISIYFLNKKARMEANYFAETNDKIDMRTAPSSVKKTLIYDQSILDVRWSICKGCEFLTESNRCLKCGCFMKIKHKFAHASCPIGKWNNYKQNVQVLV